MSRFRMTEFELLQKVKHHGAVKTYNNIRAGSAM